MAAMIYTLTNASNPGYLKAGISRIGARKSLAGVTTSAITRSERRVGSEPESARQWPGGMMTANQQMGWNLGGWLGGQVGGTAWILIAGILAYHKNPDTGMIVLVLFALANLIGFVLWGLRSRFSVHAGLQTLIVMVGVFGAAAVYVLDRADLWEAIQIGGVVSANATYGIIALMVLALMILFYVRFGRGKSSSEEITTIRL
jgi:hypothetical protein